MGRGGNYLRMRPLDWPRARGYRRPLSGSPLMRAQYARIVYKHFKQGDSDCEQEEKDCLDKDLRPRCFLQRTPPIQEVCHFEWLSLGNIFLKAIMEIICR